MHGVAEGLLGASDSYEEIRFIFSHREDQFIAVFYTAQGQLQVSPATPIPNFRSRILPRILRPQRLTPAGKLLDLLWVFEAELPWKGRSAVLLQE
jgi:hypothetical protein